MKRLVVLPSLLLLFSSPLLAQDPQVELVIGLLKDSDNEIRSLALEQIRTDVPGEEATKTFAALLPELADDGKVGLLSALADRGDSAATAAVRALLTEGGSSEVKIAAAKALGKLGKPEDVPALLDLLGTGDDEEQASIRRALVVLPGEDASTAIAAAIEGAPGALGVDLIEILATRRARNTIPALLNKAVAQNAELRRAAMTALGQIAEPEHISGMVDGVLAAERGRERDAAEKAVMVVCHRIEPVDEQAAPLLQAIEKLSPGDQAAMLSAVGRVGGPAARKLLEEAVADPRRNDLGVRALCNWPDGTIGFRLLELARTDPNPDHRRLTLRSLIRVAALPDRRSDALRLDTMKTAMAMCQEEEDRLMVLERCKAIRTVETLRFVLPYTKDATYSEMACLTVVELAHHRDLLLKHEEEFNAALDHIKETSQDEVVIDRATRYQEGRTWVRPK